MFLIVSPRKDKHKIVPYYDQIIFPYDFIYFIKLSINIDMFYLFSIKTLETY